MNLLATFAVLLLLLAPMAAEAVTPCEPDPAVQATIMFPFSPVQAQLHLGGTLPYTVYIVNNSAVTQQFALDTIISNDAPPWAPDRPRTALLTSGRVLPTVSAHKTFLQNRTITVPPGLASLCITLSVSNYNPACGNVDVRAFQQLDETTNCVQAPPPACVASSACYQTTPGTGVRVTHGICWDHTPTSAELAAWQAVNCDH